VRLKDGRILEEYGGPGRDQGVQSVKEDEAYRHHQGDKGDVIINSGRRVVKSNLVIAAPRQRMRAEGAADEVCLEPVMIHIGLTHTYHPHPPR